ncbi:unnamed protein product [Agarophyton chilense]
MPDVSANFHLHAPPSPSSTTAPPKPETEIKTLDTGHLKHSESENLRPADSETSKDHDSLQVAPQPASPASQPAVEAPASTVAPSVVPPIPQTVPVDLHRDAAAAPGNMHMRSKNRPGRPPNINENSLMRRLECIMAVETSRMTMSEACQHYYISSRTFYRWLRSKDRLIQLTGFTAEDFKNGPPPAERVALSDQMHRMPPVSVSDLHSNLPRLSQQSSIAVQAASNSIPRQPVAFALKRRMPRIPQHTDFYGGVGLMQSHIYHRNTTKMPSQTAAAADEKPNRLENGKGLMRVKRGLALSPGNEMDMREANAMYHFEDPDDVPVTSSLDTCKRRKISRGDTVLLDEPVEDDLEVSGHPNQTFLAKSTTQGATNANSNISHDQPQRQSSPEDTQIKAALCPDTVAAESSGIHDGLSRGFDLSQNQTHIPFVECSQKHRIEIVMGSKRVNLAWYHGATSADIKEAVMRRFSLVPDTQWALVDKYLDEIIISDGIPNGRYHLTVLP